MGTLAEALWDYNLIDVDISNIVKKFEIYLSNEEYFILSGDFPATVDNIHRDMKETPLILERNKYYLQNSLLTSHYKKEKKKRKQKEKIGVVINIIEGIRN